MAKRRQVKFDKETAIVLLEAGEPAGPNDVDVFLRQVLSDKSAYPLPLVKRPFRPLIVESFLAQEAAAYRQDFANIGVDSPLQRVCGGQADAIAEILGCEGYVAMIHGRPPMATVVKLMIDEGVKRAVLLPLDPQSAIYSRLAVSQFRQTWQDAGLPADQLVVLDHWENDRALSKVCAQIYAETLAMVPSGTHVIFVAKDQGESVTKQDPEYEANTRDLFALMARETNVEGEAHLGWMASRLAKPHLQPTVESLIEQAGGLGSPAVALVPFGWVADRFETLCGIDIHLGRTVRKHKLRLFRVPTINDRPEFLVAMADHINRRVEGMSA